MCTLAEDVVHNRNSRKYVVGHINQLVSYTDFLLTTYQQVSHQYLMGRLTIIPVIAAVSTSAVVLRAGLPDTS
jgi:hypothetical protein